MVKASWGRAGRRVNKAAMVLVAVGSLVAGETGAQAWADSAASGGGTTLAPVLGNAADGGAVIVWLKDQHSDLDLRTQAAQRRAAVQADQASIVASIRASGGTDVVQLVSVNAVAAHVSAGEVQALRSFSLVKEILPDGTVPVGDRAPVGPLERTATTVPDRTDARARQALTGAGTPGVNPFPTVNNCGTQDDPLIEPEALTTIHAPAMTDAGLATEPGHGVIVANDGISSPPHFDLVGNPNFVRPAADGGGSVVIGATPGDTTDESDGEYYGDASSIAAQGTVEYQYSKELPYSNLPDTCYFKLVGDAPGASLVDTSNIDTPESTAGNTNPDTLSESQLIAGIDAAVMTEHADVINESYGYLNSPGSYALHYAANDAAVDAGVTVVASAGDSGVSGTVSSPATDPKIIAVGATNTLRENAMAYGFTGWVNNDITPLSSGGTSPNNRLVDLVAPGYGGEAACNPAGSDCPSNTQTEAFGGTSESAPLVAGAAADVIQAYRDSHNGDSPSPAVVKQLLTSTASDVDAPADQQGAGLLDINAAMEAATQLLPNPAPTGTGAALIASPTQLDLAGDGGSTSYQSVSLYNTSNAATTVTGTYRELGPEHQIGDTVTENVSAPGASTTVPVDGADAAPSISFDVPAGLDRLDADMIWPDPTNSAILNFILTDPSGRLRQISYDYGTAGATSKTVPDFQHVEVADPEAGTWTVQIKWGNGRAHLQEPPNLPGSYTGTVSFKVSGQNWVTTPVSGSVTIPGHRSATVPFTVAFPSTPGDHPESVQFTADNGAATSLPIARRTLVPSGGGEFDTTITGTVGRGIGQISTFDVDVPAGRADLGVTLSTPDTSADDPMTLFLVDPSGVSVATHVVNGRARNGLPLSVQDVDGTPMQTATYDVASPAAGTWEIDVELNLTTSGKEFTQTVVGDVLPQAPTIDAALDGTTAASQTPTLTGTGTAGDTVTVVDAGGATVCTATVGSGGTWSCQAKTQPTGPVTLTATQADQTGQPSKPSNSVTVTIPAPVSPPPVPSPAAISVNLSLDPAAPALGQAVTLTASAPNTPDGTTVTFLDGSATLGTGSVSSGIATLALPSGLGVGRHQLTASVPATESTLAAVSPAVDVTIAKAASTIALTLSKSRIGYGHRVTGSITVGDASGGTATVSYGSTHRSVAIGAAGSGTFTLPRTLSVGKHAIHARYDGTTTVAASGRVTAALTVTKDATRTTLTPANQTLSPGGTEQIDVHVIGHVRQLYPDGLITVTATVDGKHRAKTVRLRRSGHGLITLSIRLPSRAGAVRLRAVYRGDQQFATSRSTIETVTAS